MAATPLERLCLERQPHCKKNTVLSYISLPQQGLVTQRAPAKKCSVVWQGSWPWLTFVTTQCSLISQGAAVAKYLQVHIPRLLCNVTALFLLFTLLSSKDKNAAVITLQSYKILFHCIIWDILRSNHTDLPGLYFIVSPLPKTTHPQRYGRFSKKVKGALSCFGEEIQSQDCNIYNMNEVIIQTFP